MWLASRQCANGEQASVCAIVDRDGSDGYATLNETQSVKSHKLGRWWWCTYRHLDDAMKGIDAVERAPFDGHTDNGQCGHRCNHAGKVGRTACSGNDYPQSPRSRRTRILNKSVRGAVSRYDSQLVGNLEARQDLRGRKHDGEI